jgi:hypothetical protein
VHATSPRRPAAAAGSTSTRPAHARLLDESLRNIKEIPPSFYINVPFG